MPQIRHVSSESIRHLKNARTRVPAVQAPPHFNRKGPKPDYRKKNPIDVQVRRISKRIILDRRHQEMIRKKMFDGTLHPSMMVLLYYYGFGKPKETVETTPPVPVKIVHEYTGPEE